MQQNSAKYREEDEIDLRELFKTLMKWKKFIIIFTVLVTLVALIFVFIKTPIYEIKAYVEVGSIKHNNNNNNNNNNNSAIENPNNLVKRLQISYIDGSDKEETTFLRSVSAVKKTENLVELVVDSVSNEKAKIKLNEIIDDIKLQHQSKIDNYKALIIENINNLKSQKQMLENSKNNFEGSQLINYNLSSKINELNLEISSYSIKQTDVIGKIIVNDYPVKPKKKLIVIVAFITGLILSIFLVFFLEFIRNEDKNGEKI